MQELQGGVATGVISVPLRYMHTPSEVVSLAGGSPYVAGLPEEILEDLLALSDSQISSTVPRLAALCTVSPEFMWR